MRCPAHLEVWVIYKLAGFHAIASAMHGAGNTCCGLTPTFYPGECLHLRPTLFHVHVRPTWKIGFSVLGGGSPAMVILRLVRLYCNASDCVLLHVVLSALTGMVGEW